MLAAFTVGALISQPASAQQTSAGHQQVLSANPFGLLLEFFNAEYERRAGETVTVGVGGSTASYDDDFTGEEDRYVNADVFLRYYPQARIFDGWNFGVKAGVTKLDSGTYPGFGFDVNRSWLLGRGENFYVSVGAGLKRLIGDVGPGEIEFIPTLRIVNVGFAF